MMHGVTTRLPRIAHERIQYEEWTIPAYVHHPILVNRYIHEIADTI